MLKGTSKSVSPLYSQKIHLDILSCLFGLITRRNGLKKNIPNAISLKMSSTSGYAQRTAKTYMTLSRTCCQSRFGRILESRQMRLTNRLKKTGLCRYLCLMTAVHISCLLSRLLSLARLLSRQRVTLFVTGNNKAAFPSLCYFLLFDSAKAAATFKTHRVQKLM